MSLSKKGESEKAVALLRQVLAKYPSNKRAQNGVYGKRYRLPREKFIKIV